jgi:2-methylcitrate dehydratase PrpD
VSAAAGPGGRLCRFVAATRFEELPKPVVDLARLAVLDWWGVTVAGAAEPVARLLRETLAEPPGPATVLGTDGSAAPVPAALLNGTAAHALDYDDVALALPGHLTAPLLPGLLALAEARRLSGRAVLTAFVAGVEVTCRVARALAPGHYAAGWHATATLGRLGGAAACARLLGLDPGGLDGALGLAAAQLGGIQESFGTMAKPLQVGRAAADALLAALLAERGVTGPTAVLDRPAWARRLSPDWTPAALDEGLGEAWALAEIIFKRFPCCFATHAAIAALLELAPLADPGAVEAVDLEVCGTTLQVADQRDPETGLGGKFSMSYCAASALVRGHVREADFSDAAVRDPAVRALANRVRLSRGADLDETRARAAVRFQDGTVRTARADLRAGLDPDRVRGALVAKFDTLTAGRPGVAAGTRLRETLLGLDEVDDLSALTGGRRRA